MKNTIKVVRKVLADELKYNDTVLLSYKIEYPQFISDSFRLCLSTVNKFYLKKAKELQEYYETTLFEMAVEQYKNDIENDFPVRSFEGMLVFEITYLSSCIISVFFDRYEYTGGAHGSTVRASQTWNVQKCTRLNLMNLIRCTSDPKSYVLDIVEAQIREEPDIYFENYSELIWENYNENSFYCTEKGIVFYYQQYDIAPYSSGMRTFLIPYSKCVLTPEQTCFSV